MKEMLWGKKTAQNWPIRLIGITAILVLFMLFGNAWGTEIPLDLDSWNLEEPWGGVATLLQEADEIKFTGSGYRDRTRIRSDYHGNFQNAVINMQWMAHGGLYNDYAGFWLGAGYTYDHPQYGNLAALPASQGFMTTHHSYSGSTIIQSDTWYYTSIIITPDQHVVTYTTTGDYYDQDGTTFYSNSWEISDTNWAFMDDAYIIAGFNDNYGGTNTWMKLGEVSFTQNNAVPEPATMLLLGSGLIGFAGTRRRFKK